MCLIFCVHYLSLSSLSSLSLSLSLSLSQSLSQDPQIDIESLNLYVTAVTSTLKAFFKVLPDPLILDTVLPALLDIPG